MVQVHQIFGIGQQIGPEFEVVKLAPGLLRDDLQDLTPPLDLNRDPGIQHLVQDAV
jgi:hypothetical protein